MNQHLFWAYLYVLNNQASKPPPVCTPGCDQGFEGWTAFAMVALIIGFPVGMFWILKTLFTVPPENP